MASISTMSHQPEAPAAKSVAAAEVSIAGISTVCNSGLPPPLESPSAMAASTSTAHAMSARTVAAHKGHRNLAIRATTAFCQGIISCSLIDVKEQYIPVAFLNFCASSTLVVQFRTGNPLMFALRGSCSWLLCLLLIYTVMCGKTWAWDHDEKCVTKAWHDARESLRIIHIFGSIRLFLNGLSLFFQFCFPHRMFAGHGNQQLFCRGCIQASGVVLHILLFTMKRTQLDGTKWERSTQEELSHFLRILFIALSSWSLFHQWWHTGVGHTGHPLSDAYEHKRSQGHGLSHSLCSMHQHAGKLRQKAKEKAEHAMHNAMHHHPNDNGEHQSKVDGQRHGEKQKESRKDETSSKDEHRETSPAAVQIPPGGEVSDFSKETSI